jgi:hypothetical protein
MFKIAMQKLVNIDYSKKKFNKIQINVLKIKIDDSIV